MREKPLILIVDDEPFNVELLEEDLQDFGYDTVSASDGEEGLAKVKEHSPDVVLLDIMMPKMNGFQVLEILSSDVVLKDIPVIIISALSDMDNIVKGIEMGAEDYLPKPYEEVMLKARVKTGVQKKQWRDIERAFITELETKNNELEMAQAKLQKANDELARLAVLDGLTQIANRRRFDMFIEEVWVEKSGEKVSLIMMDIDHFKKYNDHYGHPQGDVCLQQVASALARAVSESGSLVARYGGEEFSVVLPGLSLDAATNVANAILEEVRAQNIPHAESDTADFVTLSLGVAEKIADPKMTPETLLKAADECLYLAKEGGRNRVVSDRRG